MHIGGLLDYMAQYAVWRRVGGTFLLPSSLNIKAVYPSETEFPLTKPHGAITKKATVQTKRFPCTGEKLKTA
jgi:hypothetical protein